MTIAIITKTDNGIAHQGITQAMPDFKNVAYRREIDCPEHAPYPTEAFVREAMKMGIQTDHIERVSTSGKSRHFIAIRP